MFGTALANSFYGASLAKLVELVVGSTGFLMMEDREADYITYSSTYIFFFLLVWLKKSTDVRSAELFHLSRI